MPTMSKRSWIPAALAAALLAGFWFWSRSSDPGSAVDPELAAPSAESVVPPRDAGDAPAGERVASASDRVALAAPPAVAPSAAPPPVAPEPALTAIVFWARVVRDEDGERIPFARAEHAHRAADDEQVVRTPLAADADALVEIRTHAELEGALLVDLEGFAQASAPIVPGHETRAKAFELRLVRAATLNVRVQGPAGDARPGLRARASARGYELSQSDFWFDDAEHVRSEFDATTDADGRATLAGLPPRVDLELSVLEGQTLLMREPFKVRLDPGEVRDIVLVVGGKATLAGRAIDQTGAAVADEELWLVQPEPSMGRIPPR
jgi:hypothetical protein